MKCRATHYNCYHSNPDKSFDKPPDCCLATHPLS